MHTSIRVWSEIDSLVFEVQLDGREQIVDDSLRSRLADRLGAVDGRLSISSDPGMTRITGTIPVVQ
jgi:hypothetical protein